MKNWLVMGTSFTGTLYLLSQFIHILKGTYF
jgi:hypothetical protein